MREPFQRSSIPLTAGLLGLSATLSAAGPAFNYGAISDPIVSATFSMDVAELTAHEFIGPSQVNWVTLIDVSTGLPNDDLSGLIFGGVAYPGAPVVNLGPTQTAVISAPVNPAFYPALASGAVGLWATLTDTGDGVFAIDTLTLTITTTTATIMSHYGSADDGFGLGVPDNGNLPAALPGGLAPTGTGFDEPVHSKSIYSVPEPGTLVMLGLAGAVALFRRRDRNQPRLRRSRTAARAAALGAGLLAGGAALGGVRINEILYAENPGDPNQAVEWVELYNDSSGSQNLGGWAVSNRGGLSGSLFFRTLPAWTIPPNSYLVVYFGSGVDDADFSDGRGSYHTGDPLGINFYSAAMDEAGLYAAGAIVDFLAWRAGGQSYVPGQAATEAVAASIWSLGKFVNSNKISHGRGEKFRIVLPGHSLGRNRTSADTNSPDDWDVDGGAEEATPGVEDFEFLPFVPTDDGSPYPGDPSDPNDPNSPPTVKKWTLMLYMDADNNLEDFMYGDVTELQDAGGTDADINVVVLFDGLEGAIEAGVDGAGDINALDPLTIGGTWRFEVGPPPAGGQQYILMRTHNGDNPFLGELNMGAPQTLTDFITWSKDHYPAEHYALFINDHGLGWKGSTSDDTTVQAFGIDALYMGEIRSALAAAGLHFDLVAFDECLMGMVEVAYQVEEWASYFVGSQELISGFGYPYDDVLTDLKANPAWNGGQLGGDIVDQFHAFYQQPNPNAPATVLDPDHTLTCVDETLLVNLVQAVDGMSGDLKLACDDFQEHDDPSDNVEELIRQDARNREVFGAQATGIPADPNDPNSALVAILVISEFDYMDLCRFAQHIVADPEIPECYKDHARVVAGETTGGDCLMGAIVNHEHGANHAGANGLNIYFPLVRTTDDPNKPQVDQVSAGTAGDPNDPPVYLAYFPYDYPEFSRETDGNSRRAMYAPNADCLPKAAVDVETNAALAAPGQWPLVSSPNFRFPADTGWDEFLQRFYHPVADNHIVQGFCPCGGVVFPEMDDPECGNPTDEVTILCGWFVQFSGQGSSDADTVDLQPTHWMWDFDANGLGCGACVAPYEVGATVDAADADDDMNAEHDCNKAPLDDEKEEDADTVTRQFNLPGDFVVNLNVWDDNHQFSYHDTSPTADYVHPQTANHKSIVHVICPDQLHLVGPYPNSPLVGMPVSCQAFVEDNFVGQQNAPVTFQTLMGNVTFLNGSGAGTSSTMLLTDGSGVANVSFVGGAPGLGLIQADLPGTQLTAFIFVQFSNSRTITFPHTPFPISVIPIGDLPLAPAP